MEELIHYGTPRHSGRYPYGSGKDPYQSGFDFSHAITNYRKSGMTDKQIADKIGISTTDLRKQIAIANDEIKGIRIAEAKDLKAKGYTDTEIGKQIGMTEGGVRYLLKNNPDVTQTQISNIANGLKERLEQDDYLDIGLGTEIDMGISRTKLLNAVKLLEEEGYYTHEVKVKQISDPSKRTTILVLTKDPDSYNTYINSDKIKALNMYTEDGGLTMDPLGLKPVDSISSKKVLVRYAEDGGADKDGVIELREGAKGLDLGNSKYAQVRIGVDGTHYLKGMAIYSDDIPAGYDIIFNTNKDKTVSKKKVMKEMKTDANGVVDKDNPFGATIKKNGQRGHLNIVNEEGDWRDWSDTLSAQMLSKQPVKLVKERLDKTLSTVDKNIEQLESLTNPVVRKHFMKAYSDDLASKASHLKAEALPRSKNHVLLPIPKMKPGEVYAPNYKDGEKVVLIRYPHGGIFEIPELTVNNKTPLAKKFRNAKDAIGIHPSVASKLSGADFDGDAVMVIPNNNKQIKFSRSLKELKGFDPNQYYVGRKTMNDTTMQSQMGFASNLITDMTIKGASDSEMARAVRHSMVVIDAKKHQLDWKASARDNGISALKRKYQSHVDPVSGKKKISGSTLISKSKKKISVKGEDANSIDPFTGRPIKVKQKRILEVVGDARKLSSGTAVENQYASYMNKLMARRNKLNKTIISTPKQKTNPVAKKQYASEIKSLQDKVNRALSNAPRERQAQLMATRTYYDKLTYDMSKEDKKRLKSQALGAARAKTKSNRLKVTVTDKEWEAIQAGAITNNLLENVLRYGDQDQIMKMATPKRKPVMSAGKIARAKAMLANGNTQADVAKALGVSVSTLAKEL